jgi:hypothetical protein
MSKVHQINLELVENDYEMLFKLKKRARDRLVKQIFNTGYNIHFPNMDSELTNQQEVLVMIQSLKDEILNPDISYKIDSLETSLSKLIGLSSNSSKKGEFAENLLEDIIKKRYGDIEFKDTSKIPHSGDAWLTFSDNGIVMLESKNYNVTVNKDEIDKMERDMKEHNIKWGIFVSWNSSIQGKREFDIHTFSHEGNNYIIVMISNLCIDNSRLDLGIQLLRKLKLNFSDLKKFPWIVSDITQDLDELSDIVKMNYQLRDNFFEAETNIKNTLGIFYNKLRDYQLKLTNKSQEILEKISTTMEKSISKNLDESIEVFNQYKNTKIFSILCKISDYFIKFDWKVRNEDNNLIITKKIDDEEFEDIGRLKIFTKKVNLFFNKLNLSLDFKYTKESEDSSFETLNALKMLSNLI